MHCAALEQCSSSRRGWRRRGGGGEFFSRFCWIDWIRCCYLADYCCRAPDFFFLRILGVLWTAVAIPISPIRPSSARVLDCSRRPEFRIFRVEFELVLACVLDRIAVGKVGPILVAVGEVGRDMEGGREGGREGVLIDLRMRLLVGCGRRFRDSGRKKKNKFGGSRKKLGGPFGISGQLGSGQTDWSEPGIAGIESVEGWCW